MDGFVDAALSFPAVLFTPLLIIVVAYWAVVVAGGADPDAELGDGGLLAYAGLGGLPAAVPLSLLVAFAWFGSLAGAVLLPGWIALVAALHRHARAAGGLDAAGRFTGPGPAGLRCRARPFRAGRGDLLGGGSGDRRSVGPGGGCRRSWPRTRAAGRRTTSPKAVAVELTGTALTRIEANSLEVLADAWSAQAKTALAADPSAFYPQAVF
jgi:hypothetical protein